MRAEQPDALFEVDGFCPVCARPTRFRSTSLWLRDFFRCDLCGSIPRERAFMSAIEMFYPHWQMLSIHESSPAQSGASLRLKRDCTDYTASFFDPNVPLGANHPDHGFRCENLEHLTFPEESFDLFLTQDVFEHVFHPDRAIKEIDRVLKPGGAYIMTVPIVMKPLASQRRAKLDSSGEIIYLKEPQYHGNPIDARGVLVTIDWGYDILQFLSYHSSLQCAMIHIDDLSRGIRAEFIEVILCSKGAVPAL
jgi:Methyltransferase domain